MTERESLLSNPNIPDGKTALHALHAVELQNQEFFLSDFRTESISRTELVKKLKHETIRSNHLDRWVEKLFSRRPDLQPVIIYGAANEAPALGFKMEATSPGPTMFAALDCRRRLDESVALTNDILGKKHGDELLIASTLPVTNVYYQWGDRVISARSLQPPSARGGAIDLDVINFCRTAANAADWSELTDSGAADATYLNLTERHDDFGIETLLHEIGHQWASYLNLDKLSDDQLNLRQDLDYYPEDTPLAVYREISSSERFATIIARLLWRKIRRVVTDLPPQIVSLQRALQTYDERIAQTVLAEDLTDAELKLFFAARANRTQEGIDQIRESYHLQLVYLTRIKELLSTLGEPLIVQALEAEDELFQQIKVWGFATEAEQLQIGARIHKNGSELYDLVLQLSQVSIRLLVGDNVGLSIELDSPQQERVAVDLDPGHYGQNYEETRALMVPMLDLVFRSIETMSLAL